MKKLISIFMVVAMIVSIAAVNVSAAGEILMQDNFDSGEFNPANWILGAGANNYWIEDGIAKADRNAVVLQSYHYDPDEETDPKGPMRAWSYVSFKADFMLYDVDSDADQHSIGLWWKDYQLKADQTESTGDTSQAGVVYSLDYVVETRTLRLTADLRSLAIEEEEDEDAEETTETTTTVETEDGAEGDQEYVVASVVIPDDIEVEMDFFDPDPHSIGMMVTPNAIHGFFDDRHLLTYKTPNTIGTLMASPLLLLNDDMIVGFDNFIATTNDYGLFTLDENVVNGGQSNVNPTPTPTPSESLPPETQIVTEKVIVTDVETNEEGETVIVTREEIVSNVVTVPVADTNTGGTVGGTGAATGDMVFVVLAVMIVAVGSAIVVKKVRVK